MEVLSKGHILHCNLFDLLLKTRLEQTLGQLLLSCFLDLFMFLPALKISCNLTFLVLEVKLSTATSLGSELLPTSLNS